MVGAHGLLADCYMYDFTTLRVGLLLCTEVEGYWGSLKPAQISVAVAFLVESLSFMQVTSI